MYYNFPVASHVDDYMAAIAGRDEFYAASRPDMGLIILNYNFVMSDSFPDPATFEDPEQARLMALRRDCRGIKFDIHTGKLVSRPYHKFHNVNERPETMAAAIDWSKPHWILEKLDGSMATPHIRDGVRVWHTKMGETDVSRPILRHVEKCAENGKIDYSLFNDAMSAMNLTPIYEWCSNQQRIVIDYPQDALILTGLRHLETGSYVPYPMMSQMAQQAGIPVVRALAGSVENINVFLAETRGILDSEGYVIRFENGMMCKMKADDYCLKHKTKAGMVFEKDIWAMVLADTVDDAKPFMDDKSRSAIEAFADALHAKIKEVSDSLVTLYVGARQQFDNKRDFATLFVNSALVKTWMRPMLFAMWDGKDPEKCVTDYLAKNCGSQSRVDEVREIVSGLRWSDYYDVSVKLDD